jgi:membrane protein DedA with SNARE-associated domain
MTLPFRTLLLSVTAWLVASGVMVSGDFGPLDAMADSFWTYLTLGASAIITEELAPIFGGIAVHDDVLHMDRVITAITLGSWVATTILYWIGRAKWEFLRRKWPRVRAAGTVALRVVKRNPWRASFLVRFAFGARIFLPMACGAAHVNLPVYLFASLLGALAWSTAFTLLGYAAGEAAMRVMGHVGRVGEIIGAVVVTALVLGVIRWQRGRTARKLAKRRRENSHNNQGSTPVA